MLQDKLSGHLIVLTCAGSSKQVLQAAMANGFKSFKREDKCEKLDTKLLLFILPVPGTELHRGGHESFSTGAVSATGTRASQPATDGWTKALQEAVAENRKRRAEVRLAEESLLKANFTAAAENASRILIENDSLARMRVKWVGMHHCCPAIAMCVSATNATERVAATAHPDTSIAQLANNWVRRHDGVSAIAKKRCQAEKQTQCYQDGLCSCHRSARSARAFWKRCKSVLKEIYKTKVEEKKLVGGEVILVWVSPAEGDLPSLCLFSWVGLHYKSPWRPTFLMMDLCGNELQQDEQECVTRLMAGAEAQAGETVLLQVMSEFASGFEVPACRTGQEFARCLNLQRCWSLSAFRTSDRKAPALMAAGRVRAIAEGTCAEVWNPAEHDNGIEAALGQYVELVGEADVDDDNASSSSDVIVGAEEGFQAQPQQEHDLGHRSEDEGDDMDLYGEQLLELIRAAEQNPEEHAPPPSSTSSSDSDSDVVVGYDVAVQENVDGAVLREAPQPPAGPGERLLRDETFTLGAFRFTFRPPSGYQATCRWHRPDEGSTTKCTKAGTWNAAEPLQRLSVLRRLKSWCLQAPSFQDRRSHQGERLLMPELAEHSFE